METGGRRRRRVGDGGTPGGSDDDQARLQRVKSRRVARTASDQRLAVSVTMAASPVDHRVIRSPPPPPATPPAPNGADIHTAPISFEYPTATATAAGPAAAAAARSRSTVKRSRPHPLLEKSNKLPNQKVSESLGGARSVSSTCPILSGPRGKDGPAHSLNTQLQHHEVL